MTILIAPDSFKGTLSSAEAARAMARGIASALPKAFITELPIADGGEGTVEVLVRATRGRTVRSKVTDPLGLPVEAEWGFLGDGTTAVIEMASASGLALVPAQERDPRITTTFGTGELIRAAWDAGAQQILMGIGGSATNDGGAGMATALGVRFLNAAGVELARGGAALLGLERIDASGLDARAGRISMTVASDVDNVICGPAGASAVYGPQKGAGPEDISILDEALRRFTRILARDLGVDVLGLRGGGAAGGLGAGLAAFCGAELKRGIDVILDAVQFDEHLAKADLVITGEGTIDGQMKYGKALAGVLERAGRRQVPVLGVAGRVDGPIERYCGEGLFAGLAQLVDGETAPEFAMTHAAELLERRTAGLVSGWRQFV